MSLLVIFVRHCVGYSGFTTFVIAKPFLVIPIAKLSGMQEARLGARLAKSRQGRRDFGEARARRADSLASAKLAIDSDS